jgi:7-carboxy-7-deazaguanine synthase
MQKEYLYSEIFYSVQGEGKYTGIPTAWLRFFSCNLQCNGFGQKDPTNPSTYILPWKNINVSEYKTLEDLPVFEYGCDSSYSWAKKFKHLQHKGAPEDIGDLIIESMKTQWNPRGKFRHPKTRIEQHMCFTGGEPLLKEAQECVQSVLEYFDSINNYPAWLTFETNGTQPLQPNLAQYLAATYGHNVMFSISPKLFTTSGEPSKRAIKPQTVIDYYKVSTNGQLKFVVNGSDETWDELDNVVEQFRDIGILYPVYIMPVGATKEGQSGELSNYTSAGRIAEQAYKRGFNVSSRIHVDLWGNTIGV